MQRGFSLATLVFSGILDTSSAALELVTGVNATANGWDARNFGFGCLPNGCVPANVLNASIDDDSRWSCRPSRSDVENCELTLTLDEPQDIFELRMAMWKGDRRNRTVDVWVDGVLSTTLKTSDSTLEYEAYQLSATQASEVVLQGPSSEENIWLSITGVQLMTESADEEVLPPRPAPTGGDYIGCFTDLIADRLLTTVSSDAAITLEDCSAKCGEIAKHYYGLQQGNECWCAGCEITELDTNIDFDRHGAGTCNTPCAGDPSSTCGGDMSMSLYQSATCLATPAPTPAIIPTACSTGSTEAALHITASWDRSGRSLNLHVIEPGGVEVADHGRLPELGDVGMWVSGYKGEVHSEAYLSLNGLDVAKDAVLGDYEVWGTGGEGTKWTITARSGGELLWTAGGEFSRDQTETERFVATVTSYAESDCTNENYDKCPQDSISSTGFPPCTRCPSGVVARGGSTFCTDAALRNLDVPQNVADAMIADAAGGWAGPGSAAIYDGSSSIGLIVIEGEEPGTVTLSGNFERDDGTPLGPSAAFFLYRLDEDSEIGFVRGQGEIDPNSGNFTATTTGLGVGFSRSILSFALLDPDDAGEEKNYPYDTVFEVDVVNEGCSEELRIKLEWEMDRYLQLFVTDPTGHMVSASNPTTDIGYMNGFRSRSSGNPNTDATTNYVKEYVLFSGLSGDTMLGEYRVVAKNLYSEEPVPWTLTATVNSLVEWVEEGELVYTPYDLAQYTDDDDDGAASRRGLFTSRTDDDYTYEDYTSYFADDSRPRTDTFTVTLDSYDPAGC